MIDYRKAFRAKQRERSNAKPTDRQADLLAQLTPAEAEIVRLVDFRGLTIESAAKALHTLPATAEWRYRKAHWHLLAVA